MRGKKLFYFDLETTGLDHTRHGIHQLAAILEIDGQEVGHLSLNMAPEEGVEVTQEALDTCGVTLEEIKAYPPAAEARQKLVSTMDKFCDRFDKRDKFFLVRYNNAHFDNQFLRAFWPDKYFGSYFWSNPLDAMVLASQHLIDVRDQLANFQLGTVSNHLGLTPEGMLHDALTDTLLTRNIYRFVTGQTLVEL